MISIDFTSKINFLVSSDSVEELAKVEEFFSWEEEVREYSWKARRIVWITKELYNYGKVKGKLAMSIGYLQFLIQFCEESGIEYSINNFQEPENIKFLDKYFEHFSNHPKPEYGKLQTETAKCIEENNRGIISLPVGAGKGDLIMSLADSFLNTRDGNVVLISYSKKVCEELSTRAKQFGILDNPRLKVIQPTGYCRSNAYNEAESIRWDKEVSLFIADECHHFTANSWSNYLNRCNPDYIYGFSGTADKDNGVPICYKSIKAKKMMMSSYEVMNYCGGVLIHEELKTPIRVWKLKSSFTHPQEYHEYTDGNPNALGLAVKLTLLNPMIPLLISKFVRKIVPDGKICYIPELTSLETGDFLANKLNSLGIPTVFMSGEYCITPVGKLLKSEFELSDLKELAKSSSFKVLISNSAGVEGIDLANLSSIVSLTGRSYKNIVQAIGRSAREKSIDCLFIFDTTNKIFNRQAKARYETTINRLNVVSNTELQLGDL